MPPGPAYNWLCVLYSTAEILSHATRHRAAQIVPRSTSTPLNSPKRRRTEETAEFTSSVVVDHARVAEKGSEHGGEKEPCTKEVEEPTKGVQSIQDINIPLLVAKPSANATSTVQVNSQDDGEVVYALVTQNASTETVSFSSPFPRIIH